jgi:hypothetical protein
MPGITTIATYVGALATIAAAIWGVLVWLRPVKIVPCIHIFFDGSEPDAITAKLVNRTSKPIYVTGCLARCTYSRSSILRRHLRQPFMPIRLYPVVRFSGFSYSLMGSEPIKIEPQQPIALRHRIKDHPLAKMRSDWFLVEVTLSSGRKVRSTRERVPGRWRYMRAV